MPLLTELRIPEIAGKPLGGKQIYRQSWKRWKMQEMQAAGQKVLA